MLLAQTLRITVARSVKTGRHATGWSQSELARRARVSRQLVGSVEGGAVSPSFEAVARLFGALGIDAELVVKAPFIVDGGRQRDPVHARCGAYVQRRLVSAGWIVRREVEIVHGRSHGWIDLLAFERHSSTALVIEIKTQLDDLGRIERSLGWYEREAWQAARRLGWRPRQITGWLVVLATSAADERLGENRSALALAFPARAPAMLEWLQDPRTGSLRSRALALVDPRSRRRNWLIRGRVDGRRTAAPYRDYADFAELMRREHLERRSAGSDPPAGVAVARRG